MFSTSLPPVEVDLQRRSVLSQELTAAADIFNRKYWGGRLAPSKVFIVTKGNIPGQVGEEGVQRPLGAFFRDTNNIYIQNNHGGAYSKSQILLHEQVHKAMGMSAQVNTQHDARFVAEAKRIEGLTGFKIYFPHRHERCPGGVCARR